MNFHGHSQTLAEKYVSYLVFAHWNRHFSRQLRVTTVLCAGLQLIQYESVYAFKVFATQLIMY